MAADPGERGVVAAVGDDRRRDGLWGATRVLVGRREVVEAEREVRLWQLDVRWRPAACTDDPERNPVCWEAPALVEWRIDSEATAVRRVLDVDRGPLPEARNGHLRYVQAKVRV